MIDARGTPWSEKNVSNSDTTVYGNSIFFFQSYNGRLLYNLSISDGAEEWRKNEAEELSDLVQRRLHYLQVRACLPLKWFSTENDYTIYRWRVCLTLIALVQMWLHYLQSYNGRSVQLWEI